MRVLVLMTFVALAGCETVDSHSKSTMSDGSEIHTFRCDDDWDACYRAAATACGGRGYKEIDRIADVGTTTRDQMDRAMQSDDGINSRKLPGNQPRDVRLDGVLTIRCSQPR